MYLFAGGVGGSAEGSRDPLVLKPGAEVGLHLESSRNTKKGAEARPEWVEGDPRSPGRSASSSAILRRGFPKEGWVGFRVAAMARCSLLPSVAMPTPAPPG